MNERTCSVDGCERPVYGYELCSKHYQSAKRRGDITPKKRDPVEYISVECPCGETFTVTQKKIDAGRGRYCSLPCKRKYAQRRSGLQYVIRATNSGWYKKGDIPSEANRNGAWRRRPQLSMRGVRRSPATEFTTARSKGSANVQWKGADVGYDALHTWVRRERGAPQVCEHCGTTKNLEWANKSREYLRERDDWLALCNKCHRHYDKGTLGIATRKFGLR